VGLRIPDRQRSRIVLIGTSEYGDDRLPDLPQVRQNVRDLAAALTDPNYGIVPEGNCEVITNERDLGLIGQKLLTAAEQAADLLLVYFAGHGLVGGRRHDLYLGLAGSEWASPSSFTSLKYDDLRNAVLDSPATSKVVILDCFFPGRADTADIGDPGAELAGQMEVNGSYVLACAERDHVARSRPGGEHTAFTGLLLALLREGVPGGPELLTTDDLYRELLGTMAAAGLPQPHKRGTDTAGMVPLTRNRAFITIALPALRERYAAALDDGQRGNWEQAARQLRAAHAELDQIVGPEHEDTLRARQLLAHAVGGAGDPAEAAALLRALLPEQARVLGTDHPDVLASRQYLAVNLGEAGYRDQAVAILRVLLPDRRRLLGGDDPHSLRTAHMLARNLAAMGETSEAVALLQELADARERVLGAEHPHTIRACRDLAALRKPTS
jgi:hypothetical protein